MSSSAAVLGVPRLHLRSTDSTNERARLLAIAGAPHGTLVTASQQTSGRGRQGRRWSAPPGSSILASLIVRSPPSLLPLAAAVAVSDVAGERALIKWPNDVVIELSGDERRLAKLAGILIEGRPQEGWAVLGIGVNVAVDVGQLPPELGPEGERPAASMGLAADQVEPTLGALLAALQTRMAEPNAAILQAWRARDALLGRAIEWAGGRGRAGGIDGMGRLVVELETGGQTELSAGEVHLHAIG